MTEQNLEQLAEANPNRRSGAIVTGILLIGIGLSLLLLRVINLFQLFPLFLGLAFLVSGALTRKPGLIIPGGILGGVGLGILAVSSQWLGEPNDPAAGAIFLMAFSLGWFSIPLFLRLFTGRANLWPLIPGAIMVTIGGLILAGERGLAILAIISDYWPLTLVLVGIWVLVGYFRNNR